MKRLASLALACLLLLPGVAAGQYVMDIGSLIAALRVGDFHGDLERLSGANEVYVARLSQIAGARVSGGTLDKTLATRTRHLAYLRAAVRQTRLAMKALEIHHESLDDVIFITTTNDRTATLYVDDR
jgi:hypothetical protein